MPKLIFALIAALLLMACSDTTLPRRETPSPVFIPGRVLETIPVYPGARPSQDFFHGFGPPSIPELPGGACSGELCAGVQTASALYEVMATDNDIQVWYAHELSTMGYRNYRGGFGGVASTRQDRKSVV